MADNDQNHDEYQFAELDSYSGEPMMDKEPDMGNEPGLHNNASPDEPNQPKGSDPRLKALFVIGLIVAAMILYKIFGSHTTPPPQPTPQPIVNNQPVQPVVDPMPVQPVVNSDVENELKQKISAIELTQQNLQSDVSAMGNQLTTVTNNVNNLGTQIDRLNQLINELAMQVAKQSEELAALRTRTRVVHVKPVVKQIRHPAIVYYIQAVIPGRAWLIATNGSTLTVREGTKVPGYGLVKLIDSMQGRILTSSGKVIRFSQEDS